jgi:biopolymer transport protein ExbD
MQLPEEPESRYEINIVPMIDVIFAVLAFFILSSLFLVRGEGLPVDLPAAATATPQATERLTVTLTAAGELQLDETPVTVTALSEAVAERLPAAGGLVVINADTQVPHGQVIAVMDQLRRVSGVRIAIATEPE